MNSSSRKGLSNQEIISISKQTNILFSRYYIKTRVVESLFEDSKSLYGISQFQENMPEHVINSGIISPDTVDTYKSIYDAMLRGESHGSADIKIKNQDGTYHWHHADFSMIYDEKGEPFYALITFLDNNIQREKEISTEKWRAKLSSLISNSFLSAEINLSKNSIIKINENVGIVTNPENVYSLNDFIQYGIWGTFEQHAFREYNSFFERNRLLGLFWGGVYEDQFDYYIKNEENKPIWIRASVSMIKHEYSNDIIAMISFAHLENLQKDFDLLAQKVSHDSLTGILNREGIESKTKIVLSKYNPQMTYALFVIDLDNFKSINDILGHQTGDSVLKIVADVLQTSFHEDDIVGRIGGDEFIVLMSGNFSLSYLEKKSLELISKVSIKLNSTYSINNSISVGIAYGQGKFTFEKLYRLADISLYTAKRGGKSRYHIINADTNADESSDSLENQNGIISLESLADYTLSTDDNEINTPYKVLLDNIPGEVIVITINDNISITHCNNWISSYTGYTIEELEKEQKTKPFFFIHPDDLPFMKKILMDLKSGKEEATFSYRVLCKNGEHKNMFLNMVMTERSQNEAIFYGINSGADEKSSIEEQVLASRKQLDTLINAIPGGLAMIELTDSLTITHFNNWIYEFTGFSKEEYDKLRNGYNLTTFAKDDIPILKNALNDIKNGYTDTFHIVVKIVTSTGEYKDIILHASLSSRTQEKTTLYIAFLDYTLFQ